MAAKHSQGVKDEPDGLDRFEIVLRFLVAMKCSKCKGCVGRVVTRHWAVKFSNNGGLRLRLTHPTKPDPTGQGIIKQIDALRPHRINCSRNDHTSLHAQHVNQHRHDNASNART